MSKQQDKPEIVALKAEARELGLAWPTVLAVYADVKDGERLSRERDNEVRRTAWHFITVNTPASQPFWRHGFASRYGARVEKSEFTCIPGYDFIAQQIAASYPEYEGVDGTERLWAFLMSDYNKMPTREQMLATAIRILENMKCDDVAEEIECELTPF